MPEPFDLEVDHVIPESRWDVLVGGPGRDDESNLAVACLPCNRRKSAHVTAYDDPTATVQPHFNPRRHAWPEHFA